MLPFLQQNIKNHIQCLDSYDHWTIVHAKPVVGITSTFCFFRYFMIACFLLLFFCQWPLYLWLNSPTPFDILSIQISRFYIVLEASLCPAPLFSGDLPAGGSVLQPPFGLVSWPAADLCTWDLPSQSPRDFLYLPPALLLLFPGSHALPVLDLHLTLLGHILWELLRKGT